MTSNQIVTALRKQADELQKLMESAKLDVSRTYLRDATAKIRLAVGKDVYFTIGFTINCHSSGPDVEWKVYLSEVPGGGHKCLESASLQGVVSAALACLAEQPADPVGTVQAAFAEAPFDEELVDLAEVSARR